MATKSISKSVIWQLTGKFALQGIAFFTTPIFTRLLSPEDYGYTALYGSWVSIVTLIVGLQTYGSIGNARIKYAEKEVNKYLSSIMSISLISFFIIFSFCFLFRKWLSNIFEIRQDLVILVVIQSFCAYTIAFYTAKLDQFKQVEKSTLLSVSQSLIVIILSLGAVLYFKENKAIAKIYAQAIPVIIYGIYFLILIYKNGRIVWNMAYNKFCLTLTLPLLIHGVGGLIFSQSDRIMITKFQNQEQLGIYSVSYALCNVLNIIYGALNVSWVPFYMDYKKQNQEKEIISHSRRYIKLYTILSAGFVLLAYDVYKIMAPEKYWTGMKLLPIFVLAFYFDFLYSFPVNFEFYHCKTKLIPLVTISSAIINIGVNLILIPTYGFLGAAIGTLIAHLVEFVFHFIAARFILKEKFEFSWHIFAFATFVIIIVVLIAILLNNSFFIRWILALTVGIYLLLDILKQRSIF